MKKNGLSLFTYALTLCLASTLALQLAFSAPRLSDAPADMPQGTVSAQSLEDLENVMAQAPPTEAEESVTQESETIPEAAAPSESEDEPTEPDIFQTADATQEDIAIRVTRMMSLDTKAGSKISYPYPKGAMAVDLYLDGRRVLQGQVAEIGGGVYVPVQRFADLFGYKRATYDPKTETVKLFGNSFELTARVGEDHIVVNDRIFYTGYNVISIGGWIFAPLESMTKAFGATVKIRYNYYDASITSGKTTTIPSASAYYNSTDLYWLSRIISAEARGESFKGQIAVGNVVLNRRASSQFPSTVKGVIFDKKYGVQFSPVSSGTIYETPSASAVKAAKICLEGYTLSSKMLYFFNPKTASSSWIAKNRPYIMTIGNHKFYG